MKWSRGEIELELTVDQARKGSHIGRCEGDLQELRAVPEIRVQLEKLDADVVREALRELASHDHEKNLNRLLRLACGDVKRSSSLPSELSAPQTRKEKALEIVETGLGAS